MPSPRRSGRQQGSHPQRTRTTDSNTAEETALVDIRTRIDLENFLRQIESEAGVVGGLTVARTMTLFLLLPCESVIPLAVEPYSGSHALMRMLFSTVFARWGSRRLLQRFRQDGYLTLLPFRDRELTRAQADSAWDEYQDIFKVTLGLQALFALPIILSLIILSNDELVFSWQVNLILSLLQVFVSYATQNPLVIRPFYSRQLQDSLTELSTGLKGRWTLKESNYDRGIPLLRFLSASPAPTLIKKYFRFSIETQEGNALPRSIVYFMMMHALTQQRVQGLHCWADDKEMIVDATRPSNLSGAHWIRAKQSLTDLLENLTPAYRNASFIENKFHRIARYKPYSVHLYFNVHAHNIDIILYFPNTAALETAKAILIETEIATTVLVSEDNKRLMLVDITAENLEGRKGEILRAIRDAMQYVAEPDASASAAAPATDTKAAPTSPPESLLVTYHGGFFSRSCIGHPDNRILGVPIVECSYEKQGYRYPPSPDYPKSGLIPLGPGTRNGYQFMAFFPKAMQDHLGRNLATFHQAMKRDIQPTDDDVVGKHGAKLVRVQADDINYAVGLEHVHSNRVQRLHFFAATTIIETNDDASAAAPLVRLIYV